MVDLETDNSFSGPIIDTLTERFPWLADERRLQPVYVDYDWRHFGDSIAILCSDQLRVRFVKDRSQITVDVGPTKEETWWRLDEVLAAIGLACGRPRYVLEINVNRLREHFAATVQALGPDLELTRAEIHRRSRARMKVIKQGRI